MSDVVVCKYSVGFLGPLHIKDLFFPNYCVNVRLCVCVRTSVCVTKICNYFTLLRSSCRHRVLRPELMGAPKKPKSKHLSRPHRPFWTPLAAILDSLSSEQLPPAPLG